MATKKNGVISTLLNAMKKNKKTELCVYLAIGILIVLIYLFATGGKEENAGADKSSEVNVYSASEEDAEEKLAKTLSQIRGAGKVSVMITYETGSELVPAMSKSTQSSESESLNGTSSSENESNEIATVTSGGKESPVVITEIKPKVRGVIVIAEGAADISVKLSLEYATATVLGIDSNSIEVFEMKGE